ncbi:glycoside hydrolase family 3 N-terminal domain-containing protein [Halorhabdus sp. BNX81]|uniref:glycoside hydrolase family 3 N-terminal domain-containing protein n=1 Tax=Halorhabdus sp. BNX81 TaxID=2980181 RepID=UPI0023DD10CD|nr:glycoside hydrolase family 3 N-terminal domain-containing protein [Halorhabdus sp. BNX81]WEL20615.1 Beta-glucosidase, glycosyl hydrolase family 3 [Halorhabdus sp. BNX81]
MQLSDERLGQYVDDDRRAEIDEHVESLLEAMTVEEKVGQLNQRSVHFITGTEDEGDELEGAIADGEVGSLLNVTDLETKRRLQKRAVEESRLGIPLLIGYDVIHGYRTVFPTPLGQAASWNPDLAERAERIAATEASADGHNWTFAPMVDVSRDPRWGRVMEGAGESPVLGSAFARARVRGFQGEDLSAPDTVLACAKHFAGYGAVEGGREYNTVNVSETALRERHLPPFAASVEEGVGSMMNAFNVHERIPASGSESLVDGILKGEWDFPGLVVSDWASFREQIQHGTAGDRREAARKAIQAGSDIDMASEVVVDELADLVRDGDVSEARLDDAVRRVLTVKGLLGLFEDPYRYFDEQRREEAMLADEHRETAREAARQSFVLLENEDDRLPLDPADDVAVIGALADSAEDALGAWSFEGRPEDVITIRDGLESFLDREVPYAPGYSLPGEVTDESIETAVDAAADADVAVAVVGEPADITGEAASRSQIDLPGDQRRLLEALGETDTPVVAVLMNGRPLAIEWLAESVPAILDVWHPGVEGGPAVAETLFGEAVPGGHLPMSFPYNEGQIPVAHDRLPTGRPPGEGVRDYASKYLDVPNEPLYAFGHGESYTDFAYTDLTVSTDEFAPGETLGATVTVENTGEVAGRDVVQWYVHDRVGSRSRPRKELVGFETVELEPGESAEVTIEVDESDLAFWTADEEWAAEPGEFDLMVGHAADDIVDTARFELRE